MNERHESVVGDCLAYELRQLPLVDHDARGVGSTPRVEAEETCVIGEGGGRLAGQITDSQ